jgi:hypothetical protein
MGTGVWGCGRICKGLRGSGSWLASRVPAGRQVHPRAWPRSSPPAWAGAARLQAGSRRLGWAATPERLVLSLAGGDREESDLSLPPHRTPRSSPSPRGRGRAGLQLPQPPSPPPSSPCHRPRPKPHLAPPPLPGPAHGPCLGPAPAPGLAGRGLWVGLGGGVTRSRRPRPQAIIGPFSQALAGWGLSGSPSSSPAPTQTTPLNLGSGWAGHQWGRRCGQEKGAGKGLARGPYNRPGSPQPPPAAPRLFQPRPPAARVLSDPRRQGQLRLSVGAPG